MLESLDVASVEPYEGGWDYQWVEATARFAVDPDRPGNDRIVDLHQAPTSNDGCVRFEADVRLLRPAGSEGNRKLLFVVANRGLLGGVPFSAGAPVQFGSTGPLLPATASCSSGVGRSPGAAGSGTCCADPAWSASPPQKPRWSRAGRASSGEPTPPTPSTR